MSQFMPASQLTPGGLKGRGALGEPRRRKHYRAQRARSAQRAAGVESAEGFLRLQTPYDLLSEYYRKRVVTDTGLRLHPCQGWLPVSRIATMDSTDGSPSDSHPLKSGIVIDPCVMRVIVPVQRCDVSLAAACSALFTRVDPVLLLFGRPNPIMNPAAEWLRGHLPGSDHCR